MRSRSRTSSPRPRIGSRSSLSSGRSMKIDSISSSTVAVSRPSDSAEVSSGQNAGSSESEPSTACMRPVTSPSRCTLSRKLVRVVLHRRRARAPSRPPPATNCCRIPSVASICRPAYAYQPASCAMFSNPCSVRKRSSSSSGLMPGLEPAEHLQDQLLVEDDRRVRLLGADRPRVAQLVADAGERARSTRTRRCRRRPAPSCSRASGARARAPAADRRARRARVVAGSSWYVSCVPVSKRDLDEQQLEPRIVLAQRRASRRRDACVTSRVFEPNHRWLVTKSIERCRSSSHSVRPSATGTRRTLGARASADTAARRSAGSASARTSPPGS